MKNYTYIVGVDEAGRGPLAGPVAVGIVKIRPDFDWRLIPGVGDSKQVTPKNREAIFGRAEMLKQEGNLDFLVVLVGAKAIDKKGIAVVIKEAIKGALHTLEVAPKQCFVKLDGALRAPSEYQQETIIKGDAKEKVIGLASILAKVTRDRYMCRLGKKKQFQQYQFETHKGYGTKCHRYLINKYGLSTEHRYSYCQNRHLWGRL